MIQVSIIEDDLTIKKNLLTYMGFYDDLQIQQSCGSVEEFIRHLNKGQDISDILLLDIGLPGISGLEGISLIKEKKPDLDIIMLTTYDEEDKIIKALRSGACSYLSKKTPLKQIVETINLVHDGGSYMSPAIARKLTLYMTKGAIPKNQTSQLSPKQVEVIEGLVDGLTYNALAEKMEVSVSTIKTHIKRIYQTLHVKSKAEAVAKYLKR